MLTSAARKSADTPVVAGVMHLPIVLIPTVISGIRYRTRPAYLIGDIRASRTGDLLWRKQTSADKLRVVVLVSARQI